MIDGIGSPISAAVSAARLSSPQALRVPHKDASLEEIKEVAEQLEGVFFSMFVKEMRRTMSDGSMFGTGPGADTYKGLFDQMMGEHLGRTGGLGIADMVVRNAELNRSRVTMDELRESLATETHRDLKASKEGERDAGDTTKKPE